MHTLTQTASTGSATLEGPSKSRCQVCALSWQFLAGIWVWICDHAVSQLYAAW